jgi:ABC-type Fe3+/spermidine/putrescine transport system ATPase subunit
MPEVVFENVTKRYGDFSAVADLELSIEKGKLVALLGPSGCGKTTSLRMLGGFITPTVGAIHLRGQDVTRVPPHKRDTAMVFQSYALFPHLSVAGNVAYGLKRRGVSGDEIKRRVAEVLELVRIPELAGRRPAALSGGQKQRVAVARALVLQPAVLLLDEPFSALDAQVRESTRLELRRIQQETGITAMLVTHDQQEAMSVADTVVVMNKGRVEQAGTPMDIYDRPASRFVAEFIGSANVFRGRVTEKRGEWLGFDVDAGFTIDVPADQNTPPGPAIAVIRGEDMVVEPAGGADPVGRNACEGRVIVASFLGTLAELAVALKDGTEVRMRGDRGLAARFPVGSQVRLSWAPDQVRVVSDR